ncbi:twin-arginine translocation signal domain-containing protein [uncultured Draconibacterium sp.]|uniref:twin-arginine translocation signal domain-containing protein n=1 Tax=uncultured Draconibacterium sp. TaxID=1573823 RepID=UPI0025EFB767|nr:twin-arginine translocation signal domain-containing protein [uncultured Draconibacterium sp.]
MEANNTSNSRRSFIKKSCLAGSCACGFLAFANESRAEEQPDSGKLLMQQWISTLLKSIDDNTEASQQILKNCAQVHFQHLEMEKVLQPYKGDNEKFISFLEKEWGWKIDYDKDAGVVLANENKDYCVCPMVNQEKGVDSSILCYCSEGFAELMFSFVSEHQVKAEVVSSIHRGKNTSIYNNNTCIYKVLL